MSETEVTLEEADLIEIGQGIMRDAGKLPVRLCTTITAQIDANELTNAQIFSLTIQLVAAYLATEACPECRRNRCAVIASSANSLATWVRSRMDPAALAKRDAENGSEDHTATCDGTIH